MKIAKLCVIIIAFLFIILKSYFISLEIPTFHLDGAYQTASGLFRLYAGQIPGRDFFPYIGIGPYLLLFPTFILIGADMSASLFASQFWVLVTGWVAFAVLRKLYTPRLLWFDALASTTVFLVPIMPLFGQYEPNAILNPLVHHIAGNSLRPLRYFAPFLILGFYFLTSEYFSLKYNVLLIVFLTNLALIWSNDYGIPTTVSLWIYLLYKQYTKKCTRIAVYIILLSIASFPVILSLITLGHGLELLQYNFIYVAQDQWWYFGGYGRNDRIFYITDIFYIITPELYLSTIIFVLFSKKLIAKHNINTLQILLIGITCIGGGIIPTLGGHIDHESGYFGGFMLWGCATAWAVLLPRLETWTRTVVNGGTHWRPGLRKVVDAYLLAITMVFGIYNTYALYVQLQANINKITDTNNFIYIKELGGYLPITWKTYVDKVRSSKQQIVLEDYWGIWSAIARTFGPWKVDAVIHALGKTRDVSMDAINNAQIIIVTKNEMSVTWQPWNISQNYWFYKSVLEGWEIVAESPTSIVFERRRGVGPGWQSIGCSVSADHRIIIVDTHITGFYEINLHYKYEGQSRTLIFIQNNISFAANSGGYISLNPNKNNTIFPVYADLGRDAGNEFTAKTIGIGVGQLEVLSCSGRKMPNIDSRIMYSIIN